MKNKRPKQIKPHHLERLAVTYVRLARYPDGDDGQQRVAAQRCQVKYARQWGWSNQRILVLEDLGHPGTMTATRDGFRQFCEKIRTDQVGLVLVSDIARLSRSAKDFSLFLALCQETGTLVAVEGTLMDLSPIYLRESSPRQVRKNAGSTLTQRQVREVFRQRAEGKSVAEIAGELNRRKVGTTHKGTGQ